MGSKKLANSVGKYVHVAIDDIGAGLDGESDVDLGLEEGEAEAVRLQSL
jgi:hypothetical protein